MAVKIVRQTNKIALLGAPTSAAAMSAGLEGAPTALRAAGLVDRLKTIAAREKELRELMDKASDGGGGSVIGTLSYRPDYEKQLGDEKVLRRTAAEKKCALEPPAFESDQSIR